MTNKTISLVSVGELLGDFIGSEISTSLYDTVKFDRYQGGSPSNLALNMSRLGHVTKIISCVGNDNLGQYLIDQVAAAGLDVSLIIKDLDEPSSMVLVSRTLGTPDFIPYRGADKMLLPEHISDELLAHSKVFHTTCWPLSKNPSQETVLDAAKRATEHGCIISLDLNYAYKVWPNIAEAHEVIKKYMSYGGFIKLSDDDAKRFFGEISEKEVFERLMDWGAKLICFTMGAKGSRVITKDVNEFVPAKAVDVKDATGAGDSFWSGFLSAYLDGFAPAQCAQVGANMAAIKLQNIGPLKREVGREEIYFF